MVQSPDVALGSVWLETDEHGLDKERSRAALVRSLNRRGPDKPQTPDPGQEEHATGRLPGDFLDFL